MSDTRETHSPLFGLSQRLPPSNLDAEEALLGGLLANNSAFERVSFLRPDHFYDETNGRVFSAIERRIGDGKVADAVSLKDQFDAKYLARLLGAMVAPLLCGEYASVLVDDWTKRQLIAYGESVVNNGLGADPELDGQAQIFAAQDALNSIAQQSAPPKSDRGPMMMGDIIHLVEHHASLIHKGVIAPAISTGLQGLDRVLGGGIYPASFILVGGLQQHGKTDLLLQVAEHVALSQFDQWLMHRNGLAPGVLFFEFEMTKKQLGMRTTARLGGIWRSDIRNGRMTDAVTDGFRRAAEIGERLPLQVEDGTPVTLGRVRSGMRQFMRRRPCAAVIIDNITRMVDSSGIPNKDAAYSQICNELDNASKVTGVPIIALCHLPATVAHRFESPRPRRGDFPFNIERYPDQAIIVYRPELSLSSAPPDRAGMKEDAWLLKVDAWHKRKAEVRNVTEVIPAKQREDDGAYHPEMIRLLYNRDESRFTDPMDKIEGPMPDPDMWSDVT